MKQAVIFSAGSRTRKPSGSRFFYYADCDPEGLRAATLIGLAEDGADGLAASYACERLLSYSEEKGLALCGLSFEDLREELVSLAADIREELAELSALKGRPLYASFTLACAVQNSWLLVQQGSPRCLLLSGKVLRRLSVPAAELDGSPGGVFVSDGVFEGPSVLLLASEEAASVLPYPYIKDKLASPSERSLSELLAHSRRLGAPEGGAMICALLDGPGGLHGSRA